MNKSIQYYVDQTQHTACTIQSLAQVLYLKIDDNIAYADVPKDVKEHILGLTDAIEALAKDLNEQGALV